MSLSGAILALEKVLQTINTRSINITRNIFQSMEHNIALATTTGCAAALLSNGETNTHAWSLPCSKKAKAPPTSITTSSVLALKALHQRFSLMSVQCWGLDQFAHMKHCGAELRASPQLECHRYRKTTTRMTVTMSHCTATRYLRRLSTKFSHATLGEHTMHVLLL
jgi:hypothetical protein